LFRGYLPPTHVAYDSFIIGCGNCFSGARRESRSIE
jgi:hypothetical protein